MLVIAAPGQGAQSPGFLSPWLELASFADSVRQMGDEIGVDLVHYGTDADADAIRDTKIAQPLLVATGLAAAAELGLPASASGSAWAAGHSVGELTAAGIAGVLSGSDAVRLVDERGRAMAEAADLSPTGMTACLGGDRDEVLAALADNGLTPANDNGPGQIVAAGTLEQLAALADAPPPRVRLVPLSVAGAFHTRHMQPAVDRASALAGTLTPSTPTLPVLSNRDGAVCTDGADYLQRIVGQIANPVRWDLCMDAMLDSGVTGLLELPPAGTLVGIARRALKGVETFALKTPDQLSAARDFVAAHTTTSPGDDR